MNALVNTNKMKMAALLALSLLILPMLTFAQVLVPNLTTAVFDSAIRVTGTCEAGAAGGIAFFTLTRGGASVRVGEDTTLSATGTFDTTVGVPATFGAGPATLTLNCPSGATVSSPVVIVNAAVSPLTVSTTTPDVGGMVTISGFCPVGDIGAAGGVTLAVNNAGTVTVLGNTPVTAGGAFSSTVTIPGTVAAGSATIVATCPNGASVTTAAVLDPAPAGTVPVLTPVGAGGGVTVSPAGGVAAGSGGTSNMLLAIALVALGAVGLALSRRLALR